MSQAAIADAIGVDRSVITRLERGDIDVGSTIRARASACLGADFRLHLYRERSPLLFDAAHARIVDRLLRMTHRTWRPLVEASVPGPGRRSVDVRLERSGEVVLVEVETRLRRLEEIVRELHSKREALGGEARSVHVVLALPPTRNHQAIARAHPALLKAAFPTPSGDLFTALSSRSGRWPGDGIFWIAGS